MYEFEYLEIDVSEFFSCISHEFSNIELDAMPDELELIIKYEYDEEGADNIEVFFNSVEVVFHKFNYNYYEELCGENFQSMQENSRDAIADLKREEMRDNQ